MIKKKNLIFPLILFLLSNCSFDNKTGIWEEVISEKKRIAKIKQEQTKDENTIRIFSSQNIYEKEKKIEKTISISKAKKNFQWIMPGNNYQNYLGNIYLPGITNMFLKKKIGKNKLSLSKTSTKPLAIKNYLYLADDKGTIYKITVYGEIVWKKNVYSKVYKNIYKNISFSLYKGNLYVSDNIGFIYSISSDDGQLIWIKNHGVPLKSKIKVYEDKIFLVNQDNRIICFSSVDGAVIWSIRSIASFIKLQDLLSIALSDNGNIIVSTTSGDLLKINHTNGSVFWSLNTLESMQTDATDFFKSSDIVLSRKSIIFSNKNKIFSFNTDNGYMNWKNNVSSVATPIIDGENIFIVTENGFFVIVDFLSGEIISSTNILQILKQKKQRTQVKGFIMGSGKIYSVTLNGFLITSSASTGEVESFVKIGRPITSAPIISDGKLFIYTEDSRILGYQ